jgi:hypothetical protein
VPIKVPCRASGSKIGHLDFYLTNEDTEQINLMGERFEAHVVVHW